MSIVKQIIHRKNENGNYDDVYLRTSADQVITTDSNTVQNVLTTHGNDIDDLKSSVSNGKSLIASAITDKGVSTSSTATFQQMANNIGSISSEAYAYIVVNYTEGATCTCTKGSKTYTARDTLGTAVFGVDSAGDWLVTATKVGDTKSVTISITAQYQMKSEVIYLAPDWVIACKTQNVGTTVTADSYEWIIVHKTSTAATLGLRYWYRDTSFGSNATYNGSTIAGLCITFENGLSTETKQWLNNVTVSDVTAKVFIPTYSQFNGGFSHYSTNDNRAFKDISGKGKYTWTSSKYNSSTSRVWCVYASGTFDYGDIGSSTLGFRPHMEVNIDF